MKKVSLTIILVNITVLISYSQLRLSDANGHPLLSSKYSEIEGSPYLYDNWKKGSVKLNNGNSYDDTDLKLDLVDNQLLFKSSNDEPLLFVDPVKEFTLFSSDEKKVEHYRSDYDKDGSFYEVLVNGNCELLKLHKKSLVTKATYGSSTTVKIIIDAINYYIYKSKILTQVKKDKKSILSILPDKKDELENFIKQNDLNLKDDGDLAKLIAYYNSITT